MKYISAALATLVALGFSGFAIAGPIDADESILVSELIEDVTEAGQAARRPLTIPSRIEKVKGDPAFDPLGRSMHITKALAPVVDASQPPIALAPPIVAGTIPEDASPKQHRQNHHPPGSRNQGKKKQSLFDKLFKRSSTRK
jgi:hypothetical protein